MKGSLSFGFAGRQEVQVPCFVGRAEELLNLERFLIDRMMTCDRKAL
jgi:hypothetical protein